MAQHTNKGGPAYPTIRYCDERPIGMTPGMTLRDWFAGQALAGYIANPETASSNSSTIARDCYHIADAMLHERAMPPEGRS